jgi:hypothetical protein
MQSMPITTNIVSSNPVQARGTHLQHYVIKFNKPNTLIRLIGSSTSPYKKRRTSVGNVVFSRVEHRKMREQDAEYKKKVKDY